jgi:tetratricopeptide (TPR) repeat protein
VKIKQAKKIAVVLSLSLFISINAACRRGTQSASNAQSNANQNESAPVNVDPSKFDADIAHLKSELERNPGDDATEEDLSNAYTKRADAFRAAHRLQEALRDYRAAVDINPDNEDARGRGEAVASELGTVFSSEDSTEKDLVQAQGGGAKVKESRGKKQ